LLLKHAHRGPDCKIQDARSASRLSGGERGSVAGVDTFFVPLTALPQFAADYGPFGWGELIQVKAAHCKYLFE
jgi:hypothetical protein